MNLVRHSAISPSISIATSSSYPSSPQNIQPSYSSYPQPAYGQSAAYHAVSSYYNVSTQLEHQNPYDSTDQPGSYYSPMSSVGYFPQGIAQQLMQFSMQSHMNAGAVGMFTRNLIGSLSASAFRLTDPDNKIGV